MYVGVRMRVLKVLTGLQSADSYLEAEESNSIDDIVFPVGSRGWQHRQKVVDPQREEEQETEKVAPDVHGLIGQDENAACRRNPDVYSGNFRLHEQGCQIKKCLFHLLRHSLEGRWAL